MNCVFKKTVLFCGVLVGTLMSVSLTAQDADPATLRGRAKFNGALNTGNQRTTQLGGELSFDHETSVWDNQVKIDGQWGRESSKTNSLRLGTQAEARYAVRQQDYLFAKGQFTHDCFATYDLKWVLVAGYGHKFYIQGQKCHCFGFEAGPGSRHRRVAGSKEYQHEAILNAHLDYKRKLTESAEFKQKLNFDVGRFNATLTSDSALTTRMSASIALELSFRLEHNTQVPQGSKHGAKTSSRTQVALIYDF